MKRFFSKINTRVVFFLVAMLSTLVLLWASKEMLKKISTSSNLPQVDPSLVKSQNLEKPSEEREESPEIFYSVIGKRVDDSLVDHPPSPNFQVELVGLFNKDKLEKIYDSIKVLYPQTTMVPVQAGNQVSYKIIVGIKTSEDEALQIVQNIKTQTKLHAEVKKL